MRVQDGKTYLNLQEASERMGCTKVWVRMLILDGKFKDVMRGERRTIWVNLEEIEERMKNMPREGAMKPYARKEKFNVDHGINAKGGGLGNRGDI